QLRSDVNSGSFESLVEHVSKGDIDTSLVKIIVIDEMDYILLSKTPEERPDFMDKFVNLLFLFLHWA
ncbi:hypothetical protein Tco_1519453, partial [Tanacetum coccineum]